MAFAYPPEMILRIRDVLLPGVNRDAAIELFGSVNQNYESLETPTSAFRDNLAHAVQTAAQEGWLPDLLAAAAQRVPADVDLRRLVEELSPSAATDANVDHFQLFKLNGGFPFIDRQPLRDSVRELNRAAGQRIVVVTGAEKSGKTYSLQFLYHLETHLRSFALARIDLSQQARFAGPNQALNPHHIAHPLAKQLGFAHLVEPPPEDHQWARWVFDFGELLESQGVQDPRRRWIVVDAFNKVVLTQPVADLIKELALRVGGRLTHFRLILLGYGDRLPAEVNPTVRPVQLGLIDEEHLIQFFIGYLRESKVDGTQDELAERVDDAVEAVLSGLTPNEQEYLNKLFTAVGEHLPKLLGPGQDG